MSLEFFSIPASPWSFSLLKLSGLLQQDPNLSTFAHPLWPASDSFTTPKAIDLNYLGFLWLDPFPEGFHMCWLPVPLGLCSALWMTLLSKFCAPKSLWTVTAAMKLKDSFWKESYDKRRQHIKKQRHHFANKGLYSQSYGFSNRHVRMWELDHKEGWEPKNWCFHQLKELWCWRRLLRVPWTARRSNQSILKEINPEYSLEGLKLKLNLQYFGQRCQEPTH